MPARQPENHEELRGAAIALARTCLELSDLMIRLLEGEDPDGSKEAAPRPRAVPLTASRVCPVCQGPADGPRQCPGAPGRVISLCRELPAS
jgi:hypothetical protein